MRRKKVKIFLRQLVSEYESQEWSLKRIRELPYRTEIIHERDSLCLEMELLEESEKAYDVIVSLSDGSFFQSCLPISSKFEIAKKMLTTEK